MARAASSNVPMLGRTCQNLFPRFLTGLDGPRLVRCKVSASPSWHSHPLRRWVQVRSTEYCVRRQLQPYLVSHKYLPVNGTEGASGPGHVPSKCSTCLAPPNQLHEDMKTICNLHQQEAVVADSQHPRFGDCRPLEL
jgi:hypothetical protein